MHVMRWHTSQVAPHLILRGWRSGRRRWRLLLLLLLLELELHLHLQLQYLLLLLLRQCHLLCSLKLHTDHLILSPQSDISSCPDSEDLR